MSDPSAPSERIGPMGSAWRNLKSALRGEFSRADHETRTPPVVPRSDPAIKIAPEAVAAVTNPGGMTHMRVARAEARSLGMEP